MKKRVRLTESDLHRIVKESVNRVLNEWSPRSVMQNARHIDGRGIIAQTLAMKPYRYGLKEFLDEHPGFETDRFVTPNFSKVIWELKTYQWTLDEEEGSEGYKWDLYSMEDQLNDIFTKCGYTMMDTNDVDEMGDSVVFRFGIDVKHK